MLELDTLESAYNEQADLIDQESEMLLADLAQLNSESEANLFEYEHLRSENDRLNERLIALSTCLCSFSDMSPSQQDALITNYSNLSIKRLVETKRREVKELKAEMARVKSSYIQKTDLLFDEAKHYSSSFSSSSAGPKNKLRAPYHAEIEYTKSNLFAYFVIRFDLLNSMNSINLNSGGSGSVNCFLKIVSDSVDGHSITIENSHKILDFDLSEWTIRREVHSTVRADLIKRKKLDMECAKAKMAASKPVNWKSVTSLDSNASAHADSEPAASVEVIQYKFPRNFKLKRRKKISLVASGVKGVKTKSLLSCNSLSDMNGKTVASGKRSTLTGSSSSLAGVANYTTGLSQITKSKCACCACKIMLTQKKGDVDSLEIKEVSSWGSGLLVVTKFINSKNVAKLIDYKFVQHIWVNSQQEELSLDSLI